MKQYVLEYCAWLGVSPKLHLFTLGCSIVTGHALSYQKDLPHELALGLVVLSFLPAAQVRLAVGRENTDWAISFPKVMVGGLVNFAFVAVGFALRAIHDPSVASAGGPG